jgi:hypothetical protein
MSRGLEQFTRVTVGLIDGRWDIEMRVVAGEPFCFCTALLGFLVESLSTPDEITVTR